MTTPTEREIRNAISTALGAQNMAIGFWAYNYVGWLDLIRRTLAR